MILSLEIVTICESWLFHTGGIISTKILAAGCFFFMESWRYVILVFISTAQKSLPQVILLSVLTQRCLFFTKIIVAGNSSRDFQTLISKMYFCEVYRAHFLSFVNLFHGRLLQTDFFYKSTI